MSDIFNLRVYCPECEKNFNDSTRCPKVYFNCGHSICLKCLKYSIKKAQLSSNLAISCVHCVTIHNIDPIYENALALFPKNFFGLEIIRYFNNKIKCHHTEEKKKFICFNKSCCQKDIFCIICYEETHFDCDKNLVIRYKDMAKKVKFMIPLLVIDQFRNLFKELSDVLVTSNHHFLDAISEFLEEKTKIVIQKIHEVTFDKYKDQSHFWDAMYSSDLDSILCTIDPSIFDYLKNSLTDLLNQSQHLSSLQYVFQYFIIVAKTLYSYENNSFEGYKCLELNIKSLESIMIKKSKFDEIKDQSFFNTFKEKFSGMIKTLEFDKFHTESTAFQKGLNENLETAKIQLQKSNKKITEYKIKLKPYFDQIEDKLKNSFKIIDLRLCFSSDDYFQINQKSEIRSDRPLLQNNIIRTIIQTQILSAEYYYTDNELLEIEKAILPLEDAFKKIIWSLTVDVSQDWIYDSKKKEEQIRNLCVFACKKTNSLFMNSYFKKKLSHVHLMEIKGYLKDYSEEVQFKVLRSFMRSFIVTFTVEQMKEVQRLKNDSSVSPTLARILNASEMTCLNTENKNQLSEEVDRIYEENKDLFDDYYGFTKEKNEIEMRIDSIEDRLAFELLALEFFAIMK